MPDINEALDEMVRRIVEAVHPDRIILFGSHARGDAGPDSDVDLLIIAPTDQPAGQRMKPVYRAMRDITTPKNLLWATPEEAAYWADGLNHVFAVAQREGRTIYDKEAWDPMHPARPHMTPDQLRTILRLMLTIRRFEETATEQYFAAWKGGQFMGALHTYNGQEAVAVGVCQALQPGDMILSTHRGHGHCIAKGADPGRMLAELAGRTTGYSHGYGGSMHIFAPELGLLGGNGIVGGGIPLAIGAAFSAQYRESGDIAVCFFGDGASKQGTFHESFNLAALWDLPIVFVCENNCYAATTPVSDSCPVVDIAELGHGYGAPGKTVEGNDVLAVHELAQEAVAHARSGKGPFLLEAKTYRMKPHCMVIRETRDQGELDGWAEKDPIARFEQRLQNENWMTPDEIGEVKAEVEATLAAAVQFALDSSWPDPARVADVLWA